MKKIITTLFVAMTIVSCTDDTQLKKPEPSKTQQISEFINASRNQNLTNEEIGIKLHEFILKLGGVYKVATDNNMGFAKVQECSWGPMAAYLFPDETIFVTPFNGNCGNCSNGGFLISEYKSDGTITHDYACT